MGIEELDAETEYMGFGTVQVGLGHTMTEDGVSAKRAHIRIARRGKDGVDLLFVVEPAMWAEMIADMMEAAETLGGHYRDALVSRTRYRRSGS